ncbi:MAG: DNA-binding protein WhiA [Oscillospiraceae bacterium]|nr:DNA-binding protein WhiA [Oscillospiraceae bacterium]
MSFSNEVKAELISAVTDKDKKYACLYGLIIFCNKITDDEICFQSESAEVADVFVSLMNEIFKGSVTISKDVIERKNGTSLHSFVVSDSESVRKVTETFKIDAEKREIDLKNIDNNSLSNFIAGVFLSCGSITNPESGYHLEFVINSEQLCDDLFTILNSIGFSVKKAVRKNNAVLYIKESENIEDLLTFMGAQSSTLEIINIKILKDVRNRVNRVRNCDMANLNKTSAASVRQAQDIKLIESVMGLDSLPDTLREIAEARLDNPEYSLNDLGEILDPPIGRSGVNHRLKRIKQIADGIREEMSKNE